MSEPTFERVGETSPNIGKICEALAKCQLAIHGASKDAVNPHFRQGYSTLASMWEACKEPLGTNGLAIVQLPKVSAGGVTVVTLLIHTSGEWIRGELFMPVTKNDAQGVGSALSYGRRYGLGAMVGLYSKDDDGEAAVGRDPSPVQAAFHLEQATHLYEAIQASDMTDAEKAGAISVLAGKATLAELKPIYDSIVRSNLEPNDKKTLDVLLRDRKKKLTKPALAAVK